MSICKRSLPSSHTMSLQPQGSARKDCVNRHYMVYTPVLGVEQTDGAPFVRESLQQAPPVAAPARGLAHEGRGQLLVVADQDEALYRLTSLAAWCSLFRSCPSRVPDFRRWSSTASAGEGYA